MFVVHVNWMFKKFKECSASVELATLNSLKRYSNLTEGVNLSHTASLIITLGASKQKINVSLNCKARFWFAYDTGCYGRLRGDHSWRAPAVHSCGEVEQSPGVCQRHSMGTTLIMPCLYSRRRSSSKQPWQYTFTRTLHSFYWGLTLQSACQVDL